MRAYLLDVFHVFCFFVGVAAATLFTFVALTWEKFYGRFIRKQQRQAPVVPSCPTGTCPRRRPRD